MVTRKMITLPILAGACLGIFFVNNALPSGFVPEEDQGMIYAEIETPPGATLERTNQVAREVQAICQKEEGVESVSSLAGFEILNEGTGSNMGSCLIALKNWKDRSKSEAQIIQDLEEKTKNIVGASVEFFSPPSIPGYGTASGFELRLLDEANTGDYKQLGKVGREFVKKLNQRPELKSVFSFYSANYPQYLLKIDKELAAGKGVDVDNAMENLSTMVGSDYQTSFIRFGRPYQVIVQIAPQYRALPEDILKLTVKNDRGEMVPYSDFMKMEKVYGLSEMTRHNLHNSYEISGDNADGYSSTQAINAVKEVAQTELPKGYSIDWEGLSKDESSKGHEDIFIFIICLTFVYLVLSAQYESFILPIPIILCLPVGIFGSMFCLKLVGLDNNIYAQIAMLMLIGLLGKNAVLIVEYAVHRKAEGENVSVKDAAVEGAFLRFRPILMTSFAFIAGLIPLVFATGPGAVGNKTLGTAAAGGMLIGTIVGLFIIPALYYFTGRIQEKLKMARWERESPFTEDGKYI